MRGTTLSKETEIIGVLGSARSYEKSCALVAKAEGEVVFRSRVLANTPPSEWIRSAVAPGRDRSKPKISLVGSTLSFDNGREQRPSLAIASESAQLGSFNKHITCPGFSYEESSCV